MSFAHYRFVHHVVMLAALPLAMAVGCAQPENSAEEAAPATPAAASVIDPWVHPQPGGSYCRGCLVAATHSGAICAVNFSGTLDNTYGPYPVTNLTLKLFNGTALVHQETGIAPSTGYGGNTINHNFTLSSCTVTSATFTVSNAAGPESGSVPISGF